LRLRLRKWQAEVGDIVLLYGPKRGQPIKPVVLVEENSPIYTSKLSLAAIIARAYWLTVEWLPKYPPELTYIETGWRDLRAHHLAHQAFAAPNALDQAIHRAMDEVNQELTTFPLAKS